VILRSRLKKRREIGRAPPANLCLAKKQDRPRHLPLAQGISTSARGAHGAATGLPAVSDRWYTKAQGRSAFPANFGGPVMAGVQHGRAARFPTTRWSLLDLIRRGDAEAAREALGELLTRYLPALQAHLTRGRGLAPHDADDLIQEFVAGKILERDLIAKANRQLGKFRTFLLTALDRFLIDRVRHAGAKKRSPGDADLVTIGDQDLGLATDRTPSEVFDVTWGRSVLAEALDRMRRHCETSGRTDLWGVFQHRLVDPILQGAEPVEYGQLVERFGLSSPAHASNVLTTAKRMFARTLRSVVAEYCRDDQEVESEIEELKHILAGSSE